MEQKGVESQLMICGIVDLGSNTIRLSVYQCQGEKFHLLTHRKVTAGLADYVEHGALSPPGIQVACQTLNDDRLLMENLGFAPPRVFATASLRNISNTEEAVAQLQAETGLNVEVLSGTEEARLSFLGAAHGNGPASGLLIDLGGGSTELVRYENYLLQSACSLSVGSLSLFSRNVSGLHPDKKERKAIRAQVRAQLEKRVGVPSPVPHACGVGGTVRAACQVANLLLDRPQDIRVLSRAELHQLLKRLKHPSHRDLHLLLKAAPDRIHTLIPGMLALETIAETYGVETITASPWGVREGYLRDRVLKEGQA